MFEVLLEMPNNTRSATLKQVVPHFICSTMNNLFNTIKIVKINF